MLIKNAQIWKFFSFLRNKSFCTTRLNFQLLNFVYLAFDKASQISKTGDLQNIAFPNKAMILLFQNQAYKINCIN